MVFFLLQVLGRQSGSAGIQVAELNETPQSLSYVWVKIDMVPKRLLTLTPLGPGLPSGPAKPYYKKTRVVLHLKQPDMLCLKEQQQYLLTVNWQYILNMIRTEEGVKAVLMVRKVSH